jgi:hypothetical protein
MLLDCVLGTLPATIPTIIFTRPEFSDAWYKEPHFLVAIAGTLAAIQLLFVHKMQGSPGSVFFGLRTQDLAGGPPAFITTVARAAPYLLGLCARTLTYFGRGDSEFLLLMVLVMLLAVIFIGASGLTAIFSDGRTLLDRITHTEVMKVHSIRATDTRATD